MRIHGAKLKKAAAEKGLTADALGQVIARTGLPQDRAAAAVANWMRGADHPRCKAEDINKLAQALGVAAPKIARFTCIFKFSRGSPRKAKLLTDLIRGKDVLTAENLLTYTTKRAAVDVKKALLAARTDAEQANADVTALYVTESAVDDGPRMKRFQPKDRGRAHRIIKRMSHISIALEEKA